MQIKVICAWCEKELENITSHGEAAKYEVSHGICQACKDRFLSNEQHTLDRFLNKLEAPVLVMNDQGEVVLANNDALQILGKDMESVIGSRGGDVMECAYAALPGGCGYTTHCAACTIRNNVMQTFETGVSLRKVPAYLNKQREDDIQKVRFLISTEKVNNFVLLRIDETWMQGPEN